MTGTGPNGHYARLGRFFVEVLTAHPVHLERPTGQYVCRCGMLAKYCPVQRAAVRHGLLADPLVWDALPEDLAVAREYLRPTPGQTT